MGENSYDPENDSFDYAVDAADDIDSEFESFEAEAESGDFSERDSYRQSEDSFDYAVDIEDSLAFASSVSASESEAGSLAESESVSVLESEATAMFFSFHVPFGRALFFVSISFHLTADG